MEDILIWIVEWVKDMDYMGIFLMTMIESTFIPLPAELTMIPAGYLAQQGHMSGLLIMLCAISGTVFGALINYTIAYFFGRRLILNYGQYLFMTKQKLEKMEWFFEEYGVISTFIGRLIPGVRHYIAFPAGLARMHLRLFILYTAFGGALWMFALFVLGYYIGENQMLIKSYLIWFKFTLLLLMATGGGWYYHRYRKNKALPIIPPPKQSSDGE